MSKRDLTATAAANPNTLFPNGSPPARRCDEARVAVHTWYSVATSSPTQKPMAHSAALLQNDEAAKVEAAFTARLMML